MACMCLKTFVVLEIQEGRGSGKVSYFVKILDISKDHLIIAVSKENDIF
jgi:hypothetical protein